MNRCTGLDPVDGSVVGSQPVLVGAGAAVVDGGFGPGGLTVGVVVGRGGAVGGLGLVVVVAGLVVVLVVVVEAPRGISRVVLVVLVLVVLVVVVCWRVVVVGGRVVVGSHIVVVGGLAVVVPAKARFRPGGGTVVVGCAGWGRGGAARTKLRGPSSAHGMLWRRSLVHFSSLDALASLAHDLARRFPLAWSHWSRALPAARA